MILSKANYNDLDDVYSYMGTKLKDMGYVEAPEKLKEVLTLYFSHGAIYTVKSGANEILGIIVFYLLKFEHHDVPVPTVWELLFNKKIEDIMFNEIVPDFIRAFCNVNKVAGTVSSWIGWCAPTGRQDMIKYIERVGIKSKIDREEGSIYLDVITYDKEVSKHKYDVNELLCNNTYKRID